MNKKKNVIEICVYIVIILLLMFGVGKMRDKGQDATVPAVEVPQNTERVQ